MKKCCSSRPISCPRTALLGSWPNGGFFEQNRGWSRSAVQHKPTGAQTCQLGREPGMMLSCQARAKEFSSFLLSNNQVGGSSFLRGRRTKESLECTQMYQEQSWVTCCERGKKQTKKQQKKETKHVLKERDLCRVSEPLYALPAISQRELSASRSSKAWNKTGGMFFDV